jgi:hypothetical protein
LIKPFQAPPAKRFTSVSPPNVKTEQMTPLAWSLVQLGAEMVVVVRLAKALHLPPL